MIKIFQNQIFFMNEDNSRSLLANKNFRRINEGFLTPKKLRERFYKPIEMSKMLKTQDFRQIFSPRNIA